MNKYKNSLQGVYIYHTVFVSHSVLHHISFCLHITFCEGYPLKGDTSSLKAALEKGIYVILASEMD